MSGDDDSEPGLSERRPLHLQPWVWKTGAIAFAVYMGVLIALYIFVAGRGVSFSTTVAGQNEVEVGAPAALRVGVYDIYRARFLPRTAVEVSLLRGTEATSLYRGATKADGFAHVNLRVPDIAPGAAKWHVVLEPIGMDAQFVDIDVELVAPDPPDPMAPWTDAAAEIVAAPRAPVEEADAGQPKAMPDGVEVSLVSESHTATDGLRSVLFVSTTDRATGAPVAATVDLELVKGMIDGEAPAQVRTNGGGLAALSLTPIGAQQWRATAHRGVEGEVPDIVEIAVDSDLKQYSLIFANPVWDVGEPLEVGVRTLHRSGGVYTDVYQGGRWRFGQVTGIGGGRSGVVIGESVAVRPTRGVDLVEVQTYGQALQPAAACEARYVAVPAVGMSPRDILEVLLDRAASAGLHESSARALKDSPWLQTATNREVYAQISYWLALLQPVKRDPHLLLDTQGGERTRLADEKETFRSSITWLLLVSGGFGLLVVLALVVFNLLTVRQRSQQMVAELANVDLPDVDEIGEPLAEATNLARMQGIVQLVFLFVIIALFFAAIVILLQHI